MHQITRRDCLKAGFAALGAAALDGVARAGSSRPDGREFSFHHDHVLGTTLDLRFATPDRADAETAERVALDEIERLRRVFSLHDPDSELSRLNRTSGSVAVSPDLREVLHSYEHWQQVSGGACNARIGTLVRHWAEAAAQGQLPDSAALVSTARELARPGWCLDDAMGTVRRLTGSTLDLNAVAKGHVLSRAAAAVRSAVPSLAGGLVNLGGDLVGWGDAAWSIGVQDPFQPAENSRPLGGLRLHNAAVATSGGYQRYYTIGGTRYSHLLDPRTGQPADKIASATVVAPDTVTANVLATTLCVLSPEAGLALVATVPGADCLIVTADGAQFRSPGLTLLPVFAAEGDEKPQDKPKPDDKPKADAWPDDFQITVALELPKIEGGRGYRRPYVAVWIEDADGKPVRTLSVWGNAPRWIGELTDWWKIGRGDSDLVTAVTRATRGPGKYDVVWDGKDGKGNLVPQGTYSVRVEVSREHGKHTRQTGKIDCKAEEATLTLEKNAETGDTVVEYGKKKKP